LIVCIRNKRRLDEVAAAQDDAKAHKKLSVRSRIKRKNKELQNFYRHQIRDEKREKLETLRHKFEEDNAKIAQMKALKKFKPF
jgi:hypothetical protein